MEVSLGRALHGAAVAVLAGTLLLPLPVAVEAQSPEISALRAAERKVFSDAEIAFGFYRVAFGAELSFGRKVDRIRKFVRPVRIFVDNRARPDRREPLARVIEDIRERIANIDIELTQRREQANFIVHLVRDRDLPRMVREVYGARARHIIRKLVPQCLSGFRKDAAYAITRSDVILVADAGEFVFYDCAYEELLQALGPIRDDPDVPWTMFNDNVQKGFFDVYDQYLLNILYHPRIRPGMTKAEVREMLPRIMPEVRDWVAGVNGLPR